MTSPLTAGDRAPDFAIARDGGGTVSLADYAGKLLILYFYPKADTSGCTKQALAFSALKSDFAEAGAAVLGVSADAVKALDAFKAKYKLAVGLATDKSRQVLEAYGAWGEKSMYGRRYMGIKRSTFLIGRDGRILKVWPNVKVPGHAEDVLATVKAL